MHPQRSGWLPHPVGRARSEAHQLSPSLMNSSIHQPDSRESTTITLRFDPRMLARIKRIARSRFLNYQSMMKQWLSERLEDEIK